MTAMSLDFDRSPDGEPIPAAPSFTPKHAAGEPMDDELTGGEPTSANQPAADDEPVTSGSAASEYVLAEPEPESESESEPAADEPVHADTTTSQATAYHTSAAPAWDAQAAADAATGRKAGTGSSADLDGPLLSDADELRTSWPRIQAAFVDDPREAVADAAGLVEHAAQALTSALRQRQRQLRAMWDRDGMTDGVEYADSGGAAPRAAAPDGDRQVAADGPDTEQLRLLIQRYRRLFDQLSRP
jgi:hypothetical protein